MRKRTRNGITCQIFIQQRDGGMVWVPWKAVIDYGLHNRVNIESHVDVHSSEEEFATLGSAMEAMQQRAFHIIQEKHPNVRKDEVDWCVMSEDVREFVMV